MLTSMPTLWTWSRTRHRRTPRRARVAAGRQRVLGVVQDAHVELVLELVDRVHERRDRPVVPCRAKRPDLAVDVDVDVERVLLAPPRRR